MTGLAAADPTLASFYHQPWWLVIIKVLVVFLFLMLTTLFAIWAERRIIGRMQQLEYLFGFYFKRAHCVMGAEYIYGGACAAFRRSATFDFFGFFDEFIVDMLLCILTRQGTEHIA